MQHLNLTPADRITPNDIFASRGSVIVEILGPDNFSRATVLHRHSRIPSVSHVGLDVGRT